MKDLIEELKRVMGIRFEYAYAEAAAICNVIEQAAEGKEQNQLWAYLVRFYGAVEKGGGVIDLRDDGISENMWKTVIDEAIPKAGEIFQEVTRANPLMTPEQVGALVGEAVRAEDDEVRRWALVCCILWGKLSGIGFVPYIQLTDFIIGVRGIIPEDPNIVEWYKRNDGLGHYILRVMAIMESPMLDTDLMKEVVIQEVLNEINDPVNRAVVRVICERQRRKPRRRIHVIHGGPKGFGVSSGIELLSAITRGRDSMGNILPKGVPSGELHGLREV